MDNRTTSPRASEEDVEAEEAGWVAEEEEHDISRLERRDVTLQEVGMHGKESTRMSARPGARCMRAVGANNHRPRLDVPLQLEPAAMKGIRRQAVSAHRPNRMRRILRRPPDRSSAKIIIHSRQQIGVIG
jgi:hypothetical protein